MRGTLNSGGCWAGTGTSFLVDESTSGHACGPRGQAQTDRSATVGARRAALIAGYTPASAPMTRAPPMPSPTADIGMTSWSCSLAA